MAGLAAAVRLASRGHEVHVYEANSYPGGKLSEFELQGYRFDAGPSLFTMPQYVDDLYRAAGENPADHFEYERLPVVCHYFWEDGARLLAHADQESFAREVEEKLGVPSARLRRALADSRRKYEVTGRIFLEKSLHRLGTWLNGRAAIRTEFRIRQQRRATLPAKPRRSALGCLRHKSITSVIQNTPGGLPNRRIIHR